MFSEMLSRSYSAFWNYFLQFKSSLLRKKISSRERETPFMFFSPSFVWQRIATYSSRTPDLTLLEKCSPATGFACWWSAVLWPFQPCSRACCLNQARQDQAGPAGTSARLVLERKSLPATKSPVSCTHLLSWLPRECWKCSNNQHQLKLVW